MTNQKVTQESDTISHVERISHIVEPELNALPTGNNRLRKTSRLDQRHFSRFVCLLVADYAIDKRAYKDFVSNLSLSGAFINTRNRFPVGQKLVFVLNLVGSNIYKTTASVASIRSNGVAIKFDSPLAGVNKKALFQQLLVGITCNREVCNA